MSRQFRLLLILAFGAAIVAALLWTAVRPVPLAVELATATRGPMEVTVDVDGTTRIREVWEVSAPIPGTALRSPVRVGDLVVADETVVAVVEPGTPGLLDARSRGQAEAAVREAEASLAVAESRVTEAKEDLAYSQSQLDRAKALVERGVASLVRLEDAALAHNVKLAARDAAVSAREMAESALQRAEAALIGPNEAREPGPCCVEMRAPADGVVLSVDRISERPVTAGERLLSIGDPRDLEIAAEPLSRDAVQIPPGAEARAELWGGDEVLAARLRYIEPSAHTDVSALGIEEQRVDAVFDITSPPEMRAGLGDGYAVRLRIVVWEADDVLRLPLGVLFRSGGDWAVFAVEDGSARLRPVEVGRMNDRQAEIQGGLADGDTVVAHPAERIADGTPVVAATRD